MKDLLKLALQVLKNIFGFATQSSENKGAKIPLQEESILSESYKDAVSDSLRVDHKKDKHLRTERKIVYEFDERTDFLNSLANEKQINIYFGTKEQVLEDVKTDPARVISGSRKIGEQKDLLRKIERSEQSWFIVAVHPLTVH